MAWTDDQLKAFSENDDFRVAPFREDGTTPGTPTFIWSVVADGSLYIRAYSGMTSRWYRAALSQGAGRVQAAGEWHDVTFRAAPRDKDDIVDAAYREKYAGSRYLEPMISERRRAATIEVLPRNGAGN